MYNSEMSVWNRLTGAGGRLLTAAMGPAAAALVFVGVAALSAPISENAFAGNGSCPAGQSAIKGRDNICVSTNSLEFWDWCVDSRPVESQGTPVRSGQCYQQEHSDCSVFHRVTGFSDINLGRIDICTDNGATLCPAHQAYDTDSHACADSAPTAAPVITRPVAADWKNETFTLYWRPGTGGEAQNITGFRITREQVAVSGTPHPTECDSNSITYANPFVFNVTITHDDVYQYTNNARGGGSPGVSYGTCYRWKIAAVNAIGVGPEATTHPILSRGYVHNGEAFSYDDTSDNAGTACASGRTRPYAYGGNWGGVCYPDTVLDRADKCNELRDEAIVGSATRYDEGGNVCHVDDTSKGDDETVCTSRGFDYVLSAANRDHCRIPAQCGTLSDYSADHRECHCRGWAEPASGASASAPNACKCNVEGADENCGCPADKPYIPAENSCGCPAGEVFNQFTSYCQLNPDTALLAAEVVKASPSLISVRALLDAGADPNGMVNEVRFILTAAAQGHSGVVSILITAGVDPDTRSSWFNGNIPHLMAARDSPAQGLTGPQRLDVLTHFGDAISVRGESFDWNALTSNGGHVAPLLDTYISISPGSITPNPAAALSMADYMLARGMNCDHLTGRTRYSKHCIGSFGEALVAIVDKDDGKRVLSDPFHRVYAASEVRGAAQAVVNAGLPIDNMGSNQAYFKTGGFELAASEGGHLIGLSAFNGQHFALSVLLTFGMNPKGRTSAARSALGYIGRFAGTAGDGTAGPGSEVDGIRRGAAIHYDPPKALRVLRYYIGGLRTAGKLSSFDGWNEPTTGYSGRTALENFHVYASDNNGFDAEKLEIHSLLYENGARCVDSARASGRYCEIPVRGEVSRGGVPWTPGFAVLTVTARAGSRFGSPPVTMAVAASLAADGWTLAVETTPEPDELVLSRSRAPENNTPDSPAVFTVTLYGSSGEGIQAVPVSAGLSEDQNFALFVVAALEGDAAETGRLAGLLGASVVLNAADDKGDPVLLGAARLGHADVVSVLITAGANPDARLTIFHDVNVAHLMATHDGTPQEGGGELSRSARLEVLRHFGNAVAVRGTLFNWNAEDGNGNHVSDLLRASDGIASAGDKVILREMADYMLPLGMHCGHTSDFGKRYSEFCIGTRGVVLVSLVARGADESLLVSEVLDAAAAMRAAGVSVTLAGSETEGELVPLAATRFRGEVLSVLLTMDFDPAGKNSDGRMAAHVIAKGAETTAPMMVGVLRYFIGGLLDSGKLFSFAGFQVSGPGGEGFPLELFHESASANNLHEEEKEEMHALFFESGATCRAPINERRYCLVPVTNHYPVAGDASAGAVYTITARTVAKFQTPLVRAEVFATLATLGWTLALNTGVEPGEVILSRTRGEREGDVLSVSFTLTMTAGGSIPAHYAAVEAEVVPVAYLGLLSAVERGDAAATQRWLNILGSDYIDAGDASGVPLAVVAAALGHSAVMSVLLTFGFDPDARHPRYDNGAIPHMMGRYDGPEISWEARLSVLRGFGGAVSVRATLYDWNGVDDNGDRALDLLLAAARRDAEGTEAETMGAMADYALLRGGRCVSGAAADRGHFVCTGSLGAELARVVGGLSAPVVEAENAAVRRAAQAVVDAGFPISIAYSTSGHLVAHAAARRHGGGMSVLITFGMDPKGRSAHNVQGQGRMALHHVGRGSDLASSALQMLDVLRHFIGALSVAGKLEEFDGWNETSDIGAPLLALNSFAPGRSRGDHLATERMIHSLMYERGARCDANAPGARPYCGVPVESVEFPLAASAGAVFTLTARAVAGAAFSELGSAASATLAAEGWSAEVNTAATPDEVRFSRTAQGARDLVLSLTVTLLAAQEAIREYWFSPRPLVEYAAEPADGSGGTLRADVASGGRASTGSTVSFTAAPAENFYVREWQGAGCATRENECEVVVAGDVAVTVAFWRDCARVQRVQTSFDQCGQCLNDTLQEIGGVCRPRPSLRYAAEPPIGGAGTLTADAMLITSPDTAGVFVAVGATITFTATPGAGYFVAEWRGDGGQCSGGFPAQSGPVNGEVECEVTVTLNAETQTAEDLNVVAVFRQATRDCAAENRAADANAAHLCGDCLAGYGELRGLCLGEDGDYGNIPPADVCRLLRGSFAENDAVCVNADADGTFCILDSTGADPAFPCRGLFRRVLSCNVKYDRPGLNPFICGTRCDADQIAQGGECRDD